MSFENRKYAFEDFVEATIQVRSKERLYELLGNAMSSYGFDRLNFSIKVDDAVPQQHRGFGIVSTYPTEWQQYYVEREFGKIDPVWRCATSAFRPFKWRELERRMSLTTRQVKFLRQAEEAGLHNGVGIPFTGPRTQIAGIALATSARATPQLMNLDLVCAFAHQFYEIYKRLIWKQSEPPPSMVTLSTREREVMCWVARGQSDDQIARQLNVSPDTIGYHLRNVFLKLDVNNRVAAVVRALTFGLIDV